MTPKNLKEYYAGKGQKLPSVQERSAEYARLTGDKGPYSGTAEQNTSFLQSLLKPPAPPEGTVDITTPEGAFKVRKGGAMDLTSQGSPVISSASVRNSMTERGADPSTTSFSSEAAFKRYQDQIQPKTAAPTRPSYVSEYTKLQEEKGVSGVEEQLQGLEDQEGALDAELRKFAATETEGQSGQFASGRISEAERDLLERKDYITRQKNSLTNRLNSANKTIETIMNLKQQDYKDARGEYEYELGKNLQIYNAFQGDIDKDVATARANLQIIYNALEKGNTLSPTQGAEVAKMEMEAGLPVGFYQSVKKELPDSKIISTTTREKNGAKFVDLVYQEADGSIRTASIPFGGGGGSDGTPTWEEYLKAAGDSLPNPMDINPDSELGKRLRAQYEEAYSKTSSKSPKSSGGGRSI